MAKLFPMSEDHQDLISEVFKTDAPGLASYGLNFKYLGTTKQNKVIKVSKGNPLTEYLTDEDQLIIVTLYETAFERLTPEYQKLIIANALNAIEFDDEKAKVTIKGDGSSIVEGVYLKYKEPSILAIFNGDHAIRQIIEEEKAQKAAEAEARAEKRKNKMG